MISYTALKTIHVTSAALSISGFLLRSWWMWRGSVYLHHSITKSLPHAVDTVLLISAIAMSVISAQYPIALPWLTAKVIVLCIYIVLGSIALKRGKTRRIRAWAFFGAVVCFVYILFAAHLRTPWPFLSLSQ